jgi:hypothetical protein
MADNPILDAQGTMANNNPSIISDTYTGAKAPENTTIPLQAAPPAPAPTMPSVSPSMTQANDVISNLSSQLYSGGPVAGMENQRAAMLGELAGYDSQLGQVYGGQSPFPTVPGYVDNPNDLMGGLSSISGMTAGNIGRTTGAIDTTERAYQLATSTVMSQFMDFMKQQSADRFNEQQLQIEKEKLQLEREKAGAGSQNNMLKILAAWSGVSLDDAGGLSLDKVSKELQTMTPEQKQARKLSAMAYAKDPAEAKQLNDLFDTYSKGGTAGMVSPEDRVAVSSLRKEFQTSTSDFDAVRTSYVNAKAATDSPMGDETLAQAYLVSLNPRSFTTGTASKLDLFKNAESLPGKMGDAYRKIVLGRSLSADQRQEMIQNIENKFKEYEKQYKTIVGNYKQLSESYGLDPQTIIDNPYGNGYGLAILNRNLDSEYAGITTPQGYLAPTQAPEIDVNQYIKGNEITYPSGNPIKDLLTPKKYPVEPNYGG